MAISIKILLAFAGGFIFAQAIKAIIFIVRQRRHLRPKEILAHLQKSGGMPSGHAASMFAATVYIGCACGFDSSLFALALCVTAIIIYDAVNVRYAVGQQGKALQKLLKQADVPMRVKVVEGHTWPQVFVGALLGTAIGALLYIWIG